MANRRTDKNCVDVRICVDLETDTEIIKFQARKVAATGIKSYTKPEATADLLRELLFKK